MYAIEFQSIIKNGIIEVPREYLRNTTNRVRVILLVEEDTKAADNFIDQLLAQPVRVKGFHPLTREEVYAG